MATLVGEKSGQELGISDGDIDARRFFQIRADDRTESKYDIIAAANVVYGSAHPDPEFANLVAIDFRAKQDDREWFKWIVEIDYRSPEGGVATEQLNPLLRPAQISYATEETVYYEPGTVDQTTGALQGVYANSAGELYNPPPEDELTIMVINIQRFEMEVFSVATLYDYNGAQNEDTFIIGDLVAEPGFARLRVGVGHVLEWSSVGIVTRYRPVSYQIKIHPLSWDTFLADAGSYFIPESGPFAGKRQNFITDKEPREKYIGFLDGSGNELPDGADPVFNRFEKKRRPWSILSLPPGP